MFIHDHRYIVRYFILDGHQTANWQVIWSKLSLGYLGAELIQTLCFANLERGDIYRWSKWYLIFDHVIWVIKVKTVKNWNFADPSPENWSKGKSKCWLPCTNHSSSSWYIQCMYKYLSNNCFHLQFSSKPISWLISIPINDVLFSFYFIFCKVCVQPSSPVFTFICTGTAVCVFQKYAQQRFKQYFCVL